MMPWDRSHRRSAAALHGISSSIFFLSRPSAVAVCVMNTSVAAMNSDHASPRSPPRRNGDGTSAAVRPQGFSRTLVTSIWKGPGYLGVLSDLSRCPEGVRLSDGRYPSMPCPLARHRPFVSRELRRCPRGMLQRRSRRTVTTRPPSDRPPPERANRRAAGNFYIKNTVRRDLPLVGAARTLDRSFPHWLCTRPDERLSLISRRRCWRSA